MKKSIIIAAAALLSACATSKSQLPTTPPPTSPPTKNLPDPPVVPTPLPPLVTLPPLPSILNEAPPKLPPIVDGTPKGIQRDGARTDSMYNTLAARYRALVRTYDCARDAVNTGDVSKIC